MMSQKQNKRTSGGWIIQGVRGEGKSLAAVGKIKEYMLRGRPVATNLDLYLDKLLPEHNETLAYRLPDHPRLVDFQMLPPAHDVKYKPDDMNGLLVLDEMGTWLNSRNWNSKDRLKLMNWLFLSRKLHWDIILLAQDHEMIDAQARTTLCDFLVQASRLDRQKIPYFAPVLKFLGMNSFMPRVHRYHVFYGLSTNQPHQDVWSFTGKDFYEGYDTNQIFRDGIEAVGETLEDMRATYTYLPANYLTRHVFVARLQNQIQELKKTTALSSEEPMAKKKNLGNETGYLKIGLLCLALVIFVGWRLMSGNLSLPKSTAAAVPVPGTSTPPSSAPAPAPASSTSSTSVPAPSTDYVAMQTPNLIEYLLKTYRPRLSTTGYSPETGFVGTIDFYDHFQLIETYSIKDLHALGVTLFRKPYGVDLIYAGKSFIVSAWSLPSVANQKMNSLEPSAASNSPIAQ